MKEREGNYMEAINLYLKAGLPAKAARLAMSKEVGLTGCLFHQGKEGSRARLAHLETLSLYFSSSSFVIRCYLLHPSLSLFVNCF